MTVQTKRQPTSFKLPDETLDQIKVLGNFWGPIKSLSRADVVIEAVRLAFEDVYERLDKNKR